MVRATARRYLMRKHYFQTPTNRFRFQLGRLQSHRRPAQHVKPDPVPDVNSPDAVVDVTSAWPKVTTP